MSWPSIASAVRVVKLGPAWLACAWLACAWLACARLVRDRAGNTMMMVAAGIAPLLAIIGGGIDMGRSYLSETRLQQACDAGVLAARKRLGSEAGVTGDVPAAVAEVGNRFFNMNFRSGAYGTQNRDFVMTLEENFSISGEASADVPTTIMRIFGYQEIPVEVKCEAQLSFANTDVMMVLDVTGSMNETEPGDSAAKIDLLKGVVRSFHAQLEAAKRNDARLRYGFVPYSTNVNVGGLLDDDWVVDDWSYQSRRLIGAGQSTGTHGFYTYASPVSGTYAQTVHTTYPAIFNGFSLTCPNLPASTSAYNWSVIGTSSEAVAGPPAGTRTRTTYRDVANGDSYSAQLNGNTCTIIKDHYVNYILEYDYVTEPVITQAGMWEYSAIARDVSNWRSETAGCIEERDTYEIDDYGNVDLDRALDLDLDRVPTPGDPATQWRPMYPELIYGRALDYSNRGGFNIATARTTAEYIAPHMLFTDACPPASQKLREMSASEVDGYVSTLVGNGSTYHDIGMIWGGRLLSPTGLFAAENADVAPDRPTRRHLVFLTDGQTSPVDVSYSSYGLEPLDQRRWSPGAALSLTETVEARLAFACEEVKRHNITIWLVAFGTRLNDTMTGCAGPGHAFQADDGDQLNETFIKIANSMSDLRITR